MLSWDEAREFCAGINSTLPIISDKHINNVFQRFIISDNNNKEVGASDTDKQISNSVWLDAHARNVDDSLPWLWLNGPPYG